MDNDYVHICCFKNNVFLLKIRDSIISGINSIINGGTEVLNLNKLFEDKPAAFTSLVERYGVKMEQLELYYQSSLENGSENLSNGIADFIAEPVANMISEIVAFLLIFFIVVIAVKILGFILDLIFKIPILKKLNKMLGVFLGVINGILYGWILSVAIAYAVPLLCKIYPDLLPVSTVDSTFIVKFFDDIGNFSFNSLGLF